MDKAQTKKINAEMSAALFSDTERFEMLFASHWKKVAVASVLIALIVAVIFAVIGIKASADRKVAHAFADAADAAALEKVLAANASHRGAVPARQRLIKMLADQKQYDAALKQLKLLIADEKADRMIRGQAMVDEAAILELSGKKAEAAAAFAKAAADKTLNASLRLEACCGAGRLFAEIKQPDQAAGSLRLASTIPADSQSGAYWAENAKTLLIALENGELGPKPKQLKK